MHHRTFPAALALAALAFVTGCSGGDTGDPSGAGGRQVPGVSADRDRTGRGYADPVDRCAAAILANPYGSVPGECEGLSPDQWDQVTEVLEIDEELSRKGREAALELLD
ncbi:hypothetical protein [Streptomyces sp. NPDC058751]|uniref:hypothetical protein n=1 Tax=Streptomyces sp. NPDC058751 TaxID=3346623 RepID=UPI0036AC9B11